MVLRTVIATGIACAWATLAPARDANMSFFITSKDPGQGANLGGLADADAYCTRLAEAAGITGKVWAAYLSTSAENARDRIGTLQGNACADWTSSDKGTAMVGHHDRTDDDGLFYCFAKT